MTELKVEKGYMGARRTRKKGSERCHAQGFSEWIHGDQCKQARLNLPALGRRVTYLISAGAHITYTRATGIGKIWTFERKIGLI